MGRIRALVTRYLDKRDRAWTERLVDAATAPSLDDADTLVAFSHVASPYYAKLYSLFAHALAGRGIPSCFLFHNESLDGRFAQVSVGDQVLSGSLRVERLKVSISNGRQEGSRYQWTVQPEAGKIEAEGVNIFPVIVTTLRALYKKYNLDFTEEAVIDDCRHMVGTCDLLLDYVMRLKTLAKEKGVAVKLVGWESDYIPNGVFRLLSDGLTQDGDIEYCDLGRGYPYYFGQYFRESYISAANCTRTGACDRLIVMRDEFEDFVRTGEDPSEMEQSMAKVLANMQKAPDTPAKDEIVQAVDASRAKGQSVFVLFAHAFYDMPIDDTSPSFGDMCHWISETVETFKGREDLLLLKPHPIEVWTDEPQKEPKETLASFLGERIDGKDNIILLPPRLFDVKELHSHMTCGLVWRSSVAMELAYLGVPSIVAGTPHYRILDFPYPSDAQDYRRLIENARELAVTDEQVLNVVRYIYYLEKHKQLLVDCLRSGADLGRVRWQPRKLSHYLKHGNENVDELIERMLR